MSAEELMLLNYDAGEDSESPLDCKKIQPVYPKGNQSLIYIGRTDAEAETLILWPPDVKNWLLRRDPDAGKDWGQEEKGTTEGEMVGWHHWLNGHECEQALWRTGKSGVLQSVGQTQLSNNNKKTDLLLQNLQNYVWLQTRCQGPF